MEGSSFSVSSSRVACASTDSVKLTVEPLKAYRELQIPQRIYYTIQFVLLAAPFTKMLQGSAKLDVCNCRGASQDPVQHRWTTAPGVLNTSASIRMPLQALSLTHTHIHTHTHTHTERERERERELPSGCGGAGCDPIVMVRPLPSQV